MGTSVLLVCYVLWIFVLGGRAFRGEQNKKFAEMGAQPDAASPLSPSPIRLPAVLAPPLFFAVFAPCVAVSVGKLFDDRVPQKFCPPAPNCWRTGPEPCDRDCLEVAGVAAAMPVDEYEVVALREFGLVDDPTRLRRVWAFERYTRAGRLVIRSSLFEGTQAHNVRLEKLANRRFKVRLETDEGTHGFEVVVRRGMGPDLLTTHTFETLLPTWRGEMAVRPPPITIQVPLWFGSPTTLTPANPTWTPVVSF